MRGEVVQVDIKKRLVRIRMEDAAHVVALARHFGEAVDIQVKPIPEEKQQSMFGGTAS